ncbi:MAG: polysaccharide deacetylase family protein [Pseudomonadota bacterium]
MHRPLKKLMYSTIGPAYVRMYKRYRPVILMYHGVTKDAEIDGRFDKHVIETQFSEQLRKIKKYFRIVSLEEMLDRSMYAGRSQINEPIAALTFDDGFLNNYEVAAPILEEHQAVASIFLATGYIGRERWMWTDYLEHVIYSDLSEIISPAGESVRLDNSVTRKRTLQEFKRELKTVGHVTVEEYFKQIELLYPQVKAKPYGNYAFMNWEQARALQRAGHRIGAHTVNHPLLSKIDRDEAQLEMLSSRADILQHVGHCSEIFCYPNGKKQDYSSANTAFVARHFKAALATTEGYVDANQRYEIRRIGVGRSTSLNRLLWVMTDYATR